MTTFQSFTDNENPQIITNAPKSLSVNTDPGLPTAFITWAEPTVTDNSGLITLTSTHNSGTNFGIGTTNVTYMATDAAGNMATFSFVVTVNGM